MCGKGKGVENKKMGAVPIKYGVIPPLACSITHGARPDVIIGWILVVPALLIPVKVFFAKKSA